MRNRQRQYVEATVDEEVVHASVLAAPTIADAHLDGVLVYHTHPTHLAIRKLAIRRGERNVGHRNDLLGPCLHRRLSLIHI